MGIGFDQMELNGIGIDKMELTPCPDGMLHWHQPIMFED
jgi:hypothetical protein